MLYALGRPAVDSTPFSLVATLADRAGLGLVVMDRTLRIEYANRLAEQLAGNAPTLAQGQSLAPLVANADLAPLRERIERMSANTADADVPSRLSLSPPGEVDAPAQHGELHPLLATDRTLHFALVLDGADEWLGTAGKASNAGESSQSEQERLLEKLKKANSQLVQSEKLAAIGQLAAGVAHEINNPIGYVSSNLRTLADYVRDLLRIIDAVDEATGIEALQQLKRSLEYDYIRGDAEALIGESGDGLERVKKIITALKDFSHIDEEEFRLADLHRGIDTTLNVVHSELKYKADVVKEYGQLPEVECIFSQINQVIMNLLVNAAHAIEEFGLITLRTGGDEQWAWFEVEDTGKGMEPGLINRIYDPFFTTKPVGKGTGLGLSLSYNIVQKHHGRIQVFSEVGRGTRFRVWLPIEQPLPPMAAKDSEVPS